MNDPARRKQSYPELMAAADDERSRVRPRTATPAENEHESKSSPPRSRSSMPASSLTERLEQKVRLATALLEKLPANDPRARLLHAAVLRRDEALLDGVLSELAARPNKLG